VGDIRIDRYEVNVSTNGQTQTITDVGDTSSAFVRILGDTKHGSAGPTTSSSNAGPDDACCAVALTDTDELTFYKVTGTVKIMVEVWVYTGSAGGAYEFISRGRGSISNSGSSNTSSAITGISDTDACIPFHNGYISSETSNSNFEYVPHYMYLNSSDQVVVGKNNTGGTTTVYYDVVEFTGSAWSVGHAKSSSHDTNGTHFSGGEVVTMNTASDGSSGSTFDVSDWATALIIDGTMGGDSSETGLSDTMIYILPGTGTTSIRFTLDNTSSRNDSDAYAHILQCDDMAVYHTTSSITEGNGSYGTAPSWPSGAPTSGGTDVLALEWFPGTNGEGTAHARGCIHAQIYDNSGTYEIQNWVHRSGNDCEIAYGVADLSALEDAGSVHTLTFNDVDAGAPDVADLVVTQVQVITMSTVTAGQPSLGTLALSQEHDLVFSGFDTGAPTVEDLLVTQAHDLVCNGVTAGAPDIGELNLSGATSVTPLDVNAGVPDLGTFNLTQQHQLTFSGVSSEAPDVGALDLGMVNQLTFLGVTSGIPVNGDLTITGQLHNLTFSGVDAAPPSVGQLAVLSLVLKEYYDHQHQSRPLSFMMGGE
jgi:hypothetical protein